MALDATVGGASANSYGIRAEADTYYASRPFASVWNALSGTDKDAALIFACTQMEAQIKAAYDDETDALPDSATIRQLASIKDLSKCIIVWRGEPAGSGQALSWPRTGLKNKNGFDLSSSVIPQQLKNAQFELARLLTISDRTLESDLQTQGITKIKAGAVELGFKDIPNPNVIPVEVLNMLVPNWYYCFEYNQRLPIKGVVL
jgi:hypothetical protein